MDAGEEQAMPDGSPRRGAHRGNAGAFISLVIGYAQSIGKPPRIVVILNGKPT
jgi:hypothetical protein